MHLHYGANSRRTNQQPIEISLKPKGQDMMKMPGKICAALALVSILLSACASLHQPPTTWQDYMAGTVAPEPIELHYETYGQGNPVIFLHGLGGTIYTWRHLVGPLAPHYRLILFDLKGAGESPKLHDDKYSVFDQAELIYRFIRQKDLQHVTLVGHSFGGGVALLVALRLTAHDPSRLSRLILIDTIAYPQKVPGTIRVLTTPGLGWLVMHLVPDQTQVYNMMASLYYDDSKISQEDVAAYAAPLALPGAKYALQQTMRQIMPDHIDEITVRYPEIQVPTLIIWGREDKIIPLENGMRLQQAIKNSSLVVIERCGHDPPDERPERVLEIMQKFLETGRSASDLDSSFGWYLSYRNQ
jgi:pimeloyl-ACP methyl ester carboxylesterase